MVKLFRDDRQNDVDVGRLQQGYEERDELLFYSKLLSKFLQGNKFVIFSQL